MESAFKSPVVRFLILLGLILTGLALYLPVTSFDFVNWDDAAYVYDNPFIRSFSWDHAKAWVTQPFVKLYLPLTMASYALEFQFFSDQASGYHIVNLVIHGLNVILVLFLLSHFFSSWILVGLGALLFAIHPVQAETVAWISERKTLLCAFFSLLSFMSWLRISASEQRKEKGKWWVILATTFFCALLSKITAVVLPFLFLTHAYFFTDTKNKPWLRYLFVLTIPCLILGVVTFLLYPGFKEFYANNTSWLTHGLYAISMYLWHVIYPVGLGLFYSQPQNVYWIVSGCVILFVSLFLLTKKKEIGFWLLWWLLWIAPVSSFIPVPVSDHHLYIAFIGIVGLLIFILQRFLVVGIILFSLANIACVPLLQLQLQIWKNSETLWQSVIAKNPIHYRANMQLADYYESKGRSSDAIAIYERLMPHHQMREHLHVNLINLSLALNQRDVAFEHFKRFERFHPKHPEMTLLKAYFAHHAGDIENAKALLEEAIGKGVKNPTAFYTLGRINFDQANYVVAQGSFEKAIQLNASFVEAYYYLGLAHNAQKQWDEAISIFESMKLKKMRHPAMYFQKGLAWLEKGEVAKAEEAYEESVAREPGFTSAYYHLAFIKHKQNKTKEALEIFQKASALDSNAPEYFRFIAESGNLKK